MSEPARPYIIAHAYFRERRVDGGGAAVLLLDELVAVVHHVAQLHLLHLQLVLEVVLPPLLHAQHLLRLALGLLDLLVGPLVLVAQPLQPVLQHAHLLFGFLFLDDRLQHRQPVFVHSPLVAARRYVEPVASSRRRSLRSDRG